MGDCVSLDEGMRRAALGLALNASGAALSLVACKLRRAESMVGRDVLHGIALTVVLCNAGCPACRMGGCLLLACVLRSDMWWAIDGENGCEVSPVGKWANCIAAGGPKKPVLCILAAHLDLHLFPGYLPGLSLSCPELAKHTGQVR